MRRRLTLVATWVAATVLATFVVSLGVRVVTSEVTTRRPAPLALVRAAVTTTTSTTVPPTTTTVARATTTTTTTTTVRRPRSTTTTVAPSTVRTANGQGGSVSVRFDRAGVSLVVATPTPGYAVQVYDDGPRIVSVRFRSDGHDTQVFARAGDPRIHVDEDDGRDGSGGHGGPGRR